MLVLSRKVGERIQIGDGIEVTIVAIAGNRIQLGIVAPQDMRVLRSELLAASPGRALPGTRSPVSVPSGNGPPAGVGQDPDVARGLVPTN
jgi:carbon storage regulator